MSGRTCSNLAAYKYNEAEPESTTGDVGFEALQQQFSLAETRNEPNMLGRAALRMFWPTMAVSFAAVVAEVREAGVPGRSPLTRLKPYVCYVPDLVAGSKSSPALQMGLRLGTAVMLKEFLDVLTNTDRPASGGWLFGSVLVLFSLAMMFTHHIAFFLGLGDTPSIP